MSGAASIPREFRWSKWNALPEDRVWEIAAIGYNDGGRENGRFHAIIDPGVQIPSNIQELCGVTQEEVDRKGLPVGHVMMEFAKFLQERVVLAFGAGFDVYRLEAENQRLGTTTRLVRGVRALWLVPDG